MMRSAKLNMHKMSDPHDIRNDITMIFGKNIHTPNVNKLNSIVQFYNLFNYLIVLICCIYKKIY